MRFDKHDRPGFGFPALPVVCGTMAVIILAACFSIFMFPQRHKQRAEPKAVVPALLLDNSSEVKVVRSTSVRGEGTLEGTLYINDQVRVVVSRLQASSTTVIAIETFNKDGDWALEGQAQLGPEELKTFLDIVERIGKL